MARHKRILGPILHVILRGNGKQILFEDHSDYKHFLFLLRKFRNDCDVLLLAYCLMDNHVHLLVQDPEQQISLFMKKLGVSYASYFNKKYERVGHVFQDRYLSEVVSNEIYLANVFRYILQNPEKAGIALASEYLWNSYQEYGRSGGLTDSTLLVNMIGDRESFSAFMDEDVDVNVMEASPRKHDDTWALEIIQSTCQVMSGTKLQEFPKQQRNELLALLKEKGISIRQLARLTGISRNIVQRACTQK